MKTNTKPIYLISSLFAQLYTLVMFAIGIILVMSNIMQGQLLGAFALLNDCYIRLTEITLLPTVAWMSITTLLPALLVEVLSLCQSYSRRQRVKRHMLIGNTIVMAMFAIFTAFMISWVNELWWLALLSVPLLVNVVLLLLLPTSSDDNTPAPLADNAEEQQSDIVDVVVQQPVTHDTIPETLLQDVNQSEVDTHVTDAPDNAEHKVDKSQPVVEETDLLQDTPLVKAPIQEQSEDSLYKPQELLSTAEIVDNVYGRANQTTPNATVTKLSKLQQYYDNGLITEEEYRKLCYSVLIEE